MSLNDAWAAGFFDGEGCIGAYHNGGGRYQLAVIVTNTDRRPLDIFLELYGGTFGVNKKETDPKHRTSWDVRLRGSEAEAFLRRILPYSVVNKDQIELVLNFWFQAKGDNPRRGEIAKELVRLKRIFSPDENGNRIAEILNRQGVLCL